MTGAARHLPTQVPGAEARIGSNSGHAHFGRRSSDGGIVSVLEEQHADVLQRPRRHASETPPRGDAYAGVSLIGAEGLAHSSRTPSRPAGEPSTRREGGGRPETRKPLGFSTAAMHSVSPTPTYGYPPCGCECAPWVPRVGSTP